MSSSTRTARGSTSRPLVFALGIVALGLAVLVYLLVRTGAFDGANPALEIDALAQNSAPADVLVSGNNDASGKSAAQHAAARASAIPVGVRLAGPGRLEGHVIERATGLGVPGVRIDLLPVPPAGTNFIGRMLRMDGQGRTMAQRVLAIAVAQSGSDGSFRFEGVRTGTWYVEARGPYHMPESSVRARVLASGAGGPLDVFVQGGGRVIGRVLDPDGHPATKAKVMLVSGPGNLITTAQTGDVRQVELDVDGDARFVFEGVPPGDGYEITASGSGFAISTAIGIHVTAGQDTELEIATHAGATISGRVLSVAGKESADTQSSGKSSADTQSAHDGTPLGGAQLGAIPRGLRALRCAEEILEETHCVSSADGSFTMQRVPAGEVDIIAIAPGHLPAIGAHLACVDGATAVSPDILLPRGALIAGRVIDTAGAPLAGVQVRWNMIDWKNFQFDFSFAPMMAQGIKGFDFPRTDADGKFVGGPVAGGAPWKLDFSLVGWQDAKASFDPAKDGDPASSAITVTMHHGGGIEGVVMDELRSEPVSAFTINSTDRIDVESDAPGAGNPFAGGQSVEDENGRFHLDSVKPGKARLTFAAPGYVETTLDAIEVVEGQVTKGVIVKLSPGGSLRGIVSDGEGKPVAGAQVLALPADGKLTGTPANRVRQQNRGMARQMRAPVPGGNDFPPGLIGYAANLGMLGDRAVLSRRDGSFELAGVEPGAVHVQAFHRDFAFGSSPQVVVPESGALEGVQVTMHKGGGIEGKVSDRHGQPLERAIVVAFSPAAFAGAGVANAGGLYQGQADAHGVYAIKHVSPGSYFLVVTRGDAELNPASFFGTLNFDLVSVPEDQIVRYDLTDESAGGCRVHGTISNRGRPLARGSLVALNFESDSVLGVQMKAARVDDKGHFEFAGLAPGDYQLNLDGAGPQVHMRLEVPDQPELQADLQLPEGGIEGTVIDEATNTPIENCEVVLGATDAPQSGNGMFAQLFGREGRSQRKWTDAKGHYAFEKLRTAEYELSARGPQSGDKQGKFAPSEPRKIKVDESHGERGVDIRLLPALHIAGVVRDPSGAPKKGARIVIAHDHSGEKGKNGSSGASDDVVASGSSGDDGHFEIYGLAPGTYSAVASAAGFGDGAVHRIQLVRDDPHPKDVDLALTKGIDVRVRVVDASGRAVAGARAQLTLKHGSSASAASNAGKVLTGFFNGEGTSDSDGKLDLGRFAPGEYTLDVQRGFSKTSDPNVTLKADQDEVELRIEMP